MDQFSEISDTSTTWIENLALDEINMEESGVINFSEHLDPQYLLEESSLKLMESLREKFELYVTRFNEFRGGPESGSSIKIFKISNTVNDFMLYRNSLRLVFARKSQDVISIGFLSNSGGLFSGRVSGDQPATNTPHELKAQVGPFNNIRWKFLGEDIEVDSLVRHYLTEFIQNTAR